MLIISLLTYVMNKCQLLSGDPTYLKINSLMETKGDIQL